jgi:hypothetical protein
MIRLFKTVQGRKIVGLCVPEPKNKEAKELKKIAQKKKVPRFLTHGIVLKLKKRQSINSALALPSVTFVFYQNSSKSRSEKRATEEAGNSLALTSKVKNQENKSNQNVNRLKERKSMSNYIMNTKPIKILQKKATFIYMLRNTFLEINPFFNILQKFTSLLLKRNVSLVRGAYPFICGGLKGGSTISGFKKVLYNKILVRDRRLKPAYNRRKHNVSHYMVIQNQLARLDKTFVYLGKNKLANMTSLVLKTTYPGNSPAFHWAKTKKHKYFNNKPPIRGKAIPKLVSIIEGQVTLLLWRNQFNGSLTKSRQDHRQNVLQNLRVVCKNNAVVLLKE